MKFIHLLSCGLIAGSAAAHAQFGPLPVPGGAAVASESTPEPTNALKAFNEDPGSTSTIAGASSKLAIETSNEKSVASVKIGRSRVISDNGLVGKIAFSAKSPFDKEKSDSQDLGTLSGLTNGTSVQLEAGLLSWPLMQPASARKIDQLCARAVAAIFPGYSWFGFGMPQDPVKYFNGPGMDDVSCQELLDPGNKTAVETAVKKRKKANEEAKKVDGRLNPKDPVVPKDLAKLQRQYRDELMQIQRSAFPGAHGVTLTLKGNRKEYSFASAATPSDVTDDVKEGYGASIGYSYVGFDYVIGAGISWEKSFKGAKEQQICSPIGTTGSTSCRNAALAAPAEREDEIAFLEMRRRFPEVAWLAISPRVEYSVKDSDFGVRLPIYLAPDSSRALDGGIALGWTEEDHFSASIFVGKSFKFFD